MEHEGACRLGRVDAVDRSATVALRRIVLRGEDDAHGGALSPGQLSTRRITPRRCSEQLEEIAFEQRNDRLGLRIAEPAVELEDTRTVLGQHQAGVQQADERRSSRRELGENRNVDSLDERKCIGRAHTRDRRIRPHASRVRPLVAVEGPFEVLRRDERQRCAAVADREERDLRSLEELLDDHVACRPLERTHRLVDLGFRATDVYALSRGEPVGLHDARRPRDREPRRRRHARGAQHVLGECLGAFDPGSCGARPEDQEAEPAKHVGQPEHERKLRPDHDEVHLEGTREPEQTLSIVRPNRVTVSQSGDPGVSGRGMQLRQRRRLRQLPGKRMLATSRPDDEDSHRSSLVSVLGGARAVTLAPVDEAAVTQWLARYVDAWRTYDAESIGALFSDDAAYRYHPWDEDAEIVRGRAAIVANWLEEPDAPESWDAEYHAWAVAGERAVAVGVTRYLAAEGTTVDREYHNVFLLRFDNDGRCMEFTELYMPRAD